MIKAAGALLLVALVFAVGCVFNAGKGGDGAARDGALLRQDLSETAKGRGWYVFNGDMELGEVGRPVPGVGISGYFRPAAVAAAPGREYFPTTLADRSGNHYLQMPGYKGLPEYNLYLCGHFLPHDGKVELSFRAKLVVGESGEPLRKRPVIMDYRCQNPQAQYGSVAERYPVLFSAAFRPTGDWKTYRFEVPVKGGFDYSLMLRAFASSPGDSLDGLCVDDLDVRYLGASATVPDQAALIPDRLIPAYYLEEEVALTVNAALASEAETERVRLYLRGDYDLKLERAVDIELRRDGGALASGGRNRYSGVCRFVPERYGSFNAVMSFKGHPVFTQGGDFVVLHRLPEAASPLQRKLGGHYVVDGDYQLIPSNESTAVLGLGLDAGTRVYALSGLRHAMVAFDMKRVQPREDALDFTLADAEIAMLEKYGVEPVGCLGAWWIYQARQVRQGVKVSKLPDWFFQEKFARPALAEGGAPRYVPGEKEWRLHVEGMVGRYGKRIGKWMALVEPQWVLRPEEYLAFQKTAYETVKRDNPDALFIAGDATSDQGYNLSAWMEKLHKLGFERYLDCASFNPYTSSLDYIDGTLFRYSNLLLRLRRILAPGTLLWQQELYFIANSKRKQAPGRQQVFSAGDAQRHYLLGLLNGLRGITAIAGLDSTLSKRPGVPGDVCAGLNALSSFLAGKSEVETVKTGNSLIRLGLFTGKDSPDAVGVVWALRPQGASMAVPESGGVTFYDKFGNPLAVGTSAPLGLDPLFLVGTHEAVRNLLAGASYDLGQPVGLRARSWNDQLFLEASNMSGRGNSVNLDFLDPLPPLRASFNDSDYRRFAVTGELAAGKCRAGAEGESAVRTYDILKIKDHGAYTVGVKPLSLAVGDAGAAEFWTDSERLWIKAKLRDRQVTPAAGDALYEGDAVEVFIDRTPFLRLDVDEQGKALGELSVRQYVFAAAPPKNGKTVQVIAAGNVAVRDSGAAVSTQREDDGYILTASIPLAELTSSPDADGIVGINLEVCRVDGALTLPKASLSDVSRPSFRYRLHYPLFKIPAAGGDLLRGGVWSGDLSQTGVFCGLPSARVDLRQRPEWAPTLGCGEASFAKRQRLAPGEYLLSFYAQGRQLDHMKAQLQGSAQQIFKQGELPVDGHWTRYEMPCVVGEGGGDGTLRFEFFAALQDQDASAWLAGVTLAPRRN